MDAVGRVWVNGSLAGTGFLAGPGGIALTAAHVVTTPQSSPFLQVAGTVQLELAGQRIEAEVEIPDPKLDIAVLRLATAPAVNPLLCGPPPDLDERLFPDFSVAGYPGGTEIQEPAQIGKIVRRDGSMRLLLKPGPPEGMSGGPIFATGCVVGVQSMGFIAGWEKHSLQSDNYPSGYAAALDQLPAHVIVRLSWKRTTPEEAMPFGNRPDAIAASASTRRMPPVLQIILAQDTEPGKLSIRRVRGVWGASWDVLVHKLSAFRAEHFGNTLQRVLVSGKKAWIAWKGSAFFWTELVCLVSLPRESQKYPHLEDSPIFDRPCGQNFLCLALSSSSDYGGNRTPDVVRLSTEAANAFEYNDTDVVALQTQFANRPVGLLGGFSTAAAVTSSVFDACHQLALIVVQRSGELPALRSMLFGNSDEIELLTLFQRITAARAEGHKLLVMWNDDEFLFEEEDIFTSMGE